MNITRKQIIDVFFIGDLKQFIIMIPIFAVITTVAGIALSVNWTTFLWTYAEIPLSFCIGSSGGFLAHLVKKRVKERKHE